MPTLRLEPQHPSHAALRASQLQVQDAEPFQGKVRPLRPCGSRARLARNAVPEGFRGHGIVGLLRSEEHTSELQSRGHLVCRLLLEKKKKNLTSTYTRP